MITIQTGSRVSYEPVQSEVMEGMIEGEPGTVLGVGHDEYAAGERMINVKFDRLTEPVLVFAEELSPIITEEQDAPVRTSIWSFVPEKGKLHFIANGEVIGRLDWDKEQEEGNFDAMSALARCAYELDPDAFTIDYEGERLHAVELVEDHEAIDAKRSR